VFKSKRIVSKYFVVFVVLIVFIVLDKKDYGNYKMATLKNNNLDTKIDEKLCNFHNLPKDMSKKENICMARITSKKMSKILLKKKSCLQKNTKSSKISQSNSKTSSKSATETVQENHTIETAIQWLKSTGIHLQKVSKESYLINDTLVSSGKLLIIINKRRIASKLPLFRISNDFE